MCSVEHELFIPLSKHSAAAMCRGSSSLEVPCLPGGEDDLSFYLAPHRECSYIGRPPVSLSAMVKSVCVIPCVNEKVLMVNPSAKTESVRHFAAR
ncbi:hypothetical protein FOT90_03925 [Klebsiella aerogenes]|nr:hypothetical protein [Klebsiella aerogenes]MBE0246556.1 hypothetical protein [Klebsiella aerogenes]OQR43850.1 hypothetical protein BW261_17265 [Klebsiella aerogenes]RSV84438.1 hypothetical protein EGH55_25270 [Klebsiella aerogenes]